MRPARKVLALPAGPQWADSYAQLENYYRLPYPIWEEEFSEGSRGLARAIRLFDRSYSGLFVFPGQDGR